jgi:exodeoxyribonuclease-3
MAEYKLVSWNVNGFRAMIKKKIFEEKKFLEWLELETPDVLCLQETKAHKEQIAEKYLEPFEYKSYWNGGERKGYSGVATYSKIEPIDVSYSFGIERLDTEGRHIITEYPEFTLINSYFPNGKKNKQRLQYKLDYYAEFLVYINKLRNEGKSVIFCGDVNTAHKEIDLTHPKANENTSGFLPIERKWIDKVIERGYIDTFRHIKGNVKEKYSWWSYRTNSRPKNVGWRLDYFFVSNNLAKNVKDAYILSNVYGSDHCPVGLKIKL